MNDDEFARHRSLLFTVAYEMLGSASDAEDIIYDEIAQTIGKSPAAVRQIAHRARDHVAARRPRRSVSTTEQQEAVDRFLAASRHGDLQGLLDILAPGVVLVADGGGLVPAARRPIEGAELVAPLILGAIRRFADFEAKAVWLNGALAGRIDIGGEVGAAVSFAVEHGRITRIDAMANPQKLAWLDRAAALSRT